MSCFVATVESRVPTYFSRLPIRKQAFLLQTITKTGRFFIYSKILRPRAIMHQFKVIRLQTMKKYTQKYR